MLPVTRTLLPSLRPRTTRERLSLPLRRIPLSFPPATEADLGWNTTNHPGFDGILIQQRVLPSRRTMMMAGHNKWSKIRHKKGANDRKKGLALGKASKSLAAISRECGGDRSDPRLQAAIQHAKSVKLPKDRIEDAIAKGGFSKGTKTDDGGIFVSLRFDAMMRFDAHGKCDANRDANDNDVSVPVACVITALTNNRNRTTQKIRHLVNKHGGEFLPTDHLNYLFEKVGHIEVEPRGNDLGTIEDFEEKLMDWSVEAGATNVAPMDPEDEDDDETATLEIPKFLVTTEESDLWRVVRALRLEANNAHNDGDGDASHKVIEIGICEHRYVPREEYGEGSSEIVGLPTGSEAHERFGEFLDLLEENEDVDKVYHNAVLV